MKKNYNIRIFQILLFKLPVLNLQVQVNMFWKVNVCMYLLLMYRRRLYCKMISYFFIAFAIGEDILTSANSDNILSNVTSTSRTSRETHKGRILCFHDLDLEVISLFCHWWFSIIKACRLVMFILTNLTCICTCTCIYCRYNICQVLYR